MSADQQLRAELARLCDQADADEQLDIVPDIRTLLAIPAAVDQSRRRALHRAAAESLQAAAARVAEAQQELAACATQAHAEGASWQAIGAALGITRQAAWERFSLANALPRRKP